MSIDLAGNWKVALTKDNVTTTNEISLPGTVNGAGLGYEITKDIPWISGLFNPFWFEREEYKGAQEETSIPFLAQPLSWYSGVATYEREIQLESDEHYFLFIEMTKWNVKVLVDGQECGSFTSLCVPFYFDLGYLAAGTHCLTVIVDNNMIHPYRPDAHGISDALGASWNGLCGKICLYTANEWEEIKASRKAYAVTHPRKVEVKNGNFYVDGIARYMRGTHFGGDYPLTGCAPTDDEYWTLFMKRIKEWGFNFIRCHSYCPPEEAFAAADIEDVYIQVECGMWNTFNPGEEKAIEVLKTETKLILEAFGHHPSFVMLSPSNEPGGNWYRPLEAWVKWARELDKEMGFEGRHLFTAQSGWFFDVPAKDIKAEDTDYIYFHRSGYGPRGGMIRNERGWFGRDYSICVEGAELPIICHEMGQWCSYPDFNIIDKFTGYLKPNMYKVFKTSAEKNGVLKFDKDFVYCSGRNQLRTLKEDFEANYRTKELKGFEYLDLHDYLGQGGAFVGLLDAFWDSKGYTTPEEIRRINSDTVIVSTIPKYVYTSEERLTADIIVCHFGDDNLENVSAIWKLLEEGTDAEEKKWFEAGICGKAFMAQILAGANTTVGSVDIGFEFVKKHGAYKVVVSLLDNSGVVISENDWSITVFAADQTSCEVSSEGIVSWRNDNSLADGKANSEVLYTRSIDEAQAGLDKGLKVIFNPYMSDMDYDCPTLGDRNCFWNAQMGPRWGRNNGIVVDEKHPLFKYFPTEKDGGWQWAEILNNARGYNLDPKYDNIVRCIDDWSRNFPLSLVFEGNVGKGKLLFVAAEFSEKTLAKPEVRAFRDALFEYAASGDFCPVQELSMSDVRKHLLNVYKGTDIIDSIEVSGKNAEIQDNPTEDRKIKRMNDAKEPMLIKEQNPNYPYVLFDTALPVNIKLKLKKKVFVKDLYYLAPQNDRDFLGVIKSYTINGRSGNFKNCFEMQRTVPVEEYTDEIDFCVTETYGMGEAIRWIENRQGWHWYREMEKVNVQIAALGVEYEAQGQDEPVSEIDTEESGVHNDIHFWSGSAASRHTEIDV